MRLRTGPIRDWPVHCGVECLWARFRFRFRQGFQSLAFSEHAGWQSVQRCANKAGVLWGRALEFPRGSVGVLAPKPASEGH